MASVTGLLMLASHSPMHAASGLQSFVVALSDFTILEATRADTGVSVRWTQLTLVNEECGISAMRSYEVTLPLTTLDELAGAPLCQVGQQRFGRAVRRSRMNHPMIRDGIPYGTFFDRIVATCDGRERSFTFDYWDGKPPVDPNRLQRIDPVVANLYGMGVRLRERVETFSPSPEAQESEGTRMAAAMRGGRYAGAYADMCWGDKGRRTTCRPPFWQQVLAGYDGPPTQRAPRPPMVRERETLPFTKFVQPVFPPVARAARVFGDVRMRLRLQPESGAVIDVAIVEGRPLLEQAARDAALQWRFGAGASTGDPLNVTVSFAEGCPERP
ncbi:MAG: hypothetical protein HOP14_07150 [Acidobacteria bacterium]|nr:hypothetical protein [Acidobacteriota bacterium]